MLSHLLNSNRRWAAKVTAADPGFFLKLSQQQKPQYLWIGCSDSRVPANEIVDLLPGELFVHRNVANVVVHSDLNCLSSVQYAIDVIKVRHIIVCGHYGCGGVRAALRDDRVGLADNWLRHVQDVRKRYQRAIDALDGEPARLARLCELNVIEQVSNVSQTTILHDAWSRGQAVSVHGWVYDLRDGILRDLGTTVDAEADADAVREAAIARLTARPGANGESI